MTVGLTVLAWQDVQNVERCLHGRLVEAREGTAGAVCSGGTIQVSETKGATNRESSAVLQDSNCAAMIGSVWGEGALM